VESLSLGETALSLAVGGTKQLSATVEPEDAENKALSWTSATPAVATVDGSGLVSGVTEGATVVTVATTDGSNKTATCTVTVTGVAVKVSSVTVSPATAAIETGGTVQLTAAVLPADATNKALSWSSAKPSVATVDSNGLVRGIAASATPVTITAAAGDGSGVSGTAAVTVKLPAGAVPVDSLSLSPSSAPSPFYSGSNFTISADVQPGNATDKTVNWSVSPAGIVDLSATTGSSVTVSAAGPGTATITATAPGGEDKTASMQVTVTSIVPGETVITVTSTFSGTVYPGSKIPVSAAFNPEGDLASLSWSSSDPSVATVASTNSSYNLDAFITALAPGTATITAAVQWGTSVPGTYTVIVSPVPVSSLSLDKASRKLVPGGSFQLSAAVGPDNATDKTVSWSVSPAGIVNLSATTGPTITVSAAGTGTATITAASGGESASCTVSVEAGSGLAIDFAGFGDETINLTPSYANDLSRRAHDILTVSVSGSYTSITWYLDGQMWNSGNSYDIYASSNTVGIHYLTAVVQKGDGKYFSKELLFRVVE
jgi:uncharacterized protein YjdB